MSLVRWKGPPRWASPDARQSLSPNSSEFHVVLAQDYVGPFRLLNLIRSGKTCDVWEVMNDVKGERLAIKLLSGEAARNREEVAFLKHEQQVGSGLDHPQVIKIYGFGSDHGNVYLSMELF